MSLSVIIELDNQAHTDDPAYELTCNFQRIIAAISRGFTRGRLYDSNGNDVGTWEVN